MFMTRAAPAAGYRRGGGRMIEPTPGRWTCAFRARTGARATFGSPEQAKKFAEDHAALGNSAEWAEADGGWVLRLFLAEYLVKPAYA
jgi:hypothetical protein